MKENLIESVNPVINRPDYFEKIIVYLKKYLKFILVSLIVGAVAGYCIAHFLITPTYQSYLDLYVNVNNSTSDKNTDTVNTEDIDASQKLVNSYLVTLKANIATNQIVEKLNGRISKNELLNSVSFASIDSTEILRITVETHDPQLSVDICNAYIGIAESVLDDIFGGGSVKVISSPEYPTSPSSPDVIQYIGTGGILAAAAIALICMLVMLADNKVTSEKVLSDRYSIPILGNVPDFFQFSKTLNIPRKYVKKSKKLKGKKYNNEKIITTAVVLGEKTPFLIAEAYKTIRSNILFSLPKMKNGVIIVTSPVANELKTTTTINLALSMAKIGARVLLIDGDLRNPSIHRYFKTSNKQGLSLILTGRGQFQDAVVYNLAKGVDFLAAGPVPPIPSELLGSRYMADFIGQMSSQYDFIIIDTSPVNLVSDALVLSSQAAGIILTVRESESTTAEIDKAIKAINMSHSNILGFVLTDVDVKGAGYGYYQYNYGYGDNPKARR